MKHHFGFLKIACQEGFKGGGRGFIVSASLFKKPKAARARQEQGPTHKAYCANRQKNKC
tara:strand:- start:1683 stop:1859 length:177 start_codon:yes stop_codon:yes gene_type:complete